MKFNSQICTTKIQSERLLALGLKKGTADCILVKDAFEINHYLIFSIEDIDETFENEMCDEPIPAWSFHRLIEMMPRYIIENKRRYDFSLDHGCSLYEYDKIDEFGGYEYDCIGTPNTTFYLYNDLINQIEWLIKKGYFNKEYLEE